MATAATGQKNFLFYFINNNGNKVEENWEKIVTEVVKQFSTEAQK